MYEPKLRLFRESKFNFGKPNILWLNYETKNDERLFHVLKFG